MKSEALYMHPEKKNTFFICMKKKKKSLCRCFFLIKIMFKSVCTKNVALSIRIWKKNKPQSHYAY